MSVHTDLLLSMQGGAEFRTSLHVFFVCTAYFMGNRIADALAEYE